MTYDPHVPPQLKITQQWFASIITRPIDLHSQMNPFSPSGVAMEHEACDYIAPSPTLNSSQRIELYNQQYWWRLYSILQESFPLLTRLFGYFEFNQKVAIPYLVKYPPHSWSLNVLGNRLPQWVKEEYIGNDKQLILDTALLDTAYNEGFFTTHYAGVDFTHLPIPGEISSIIDKTLRLQPHAHLFEMNYHLFNFRQEMLSQEVDYWLTHDFPEIAQGKKFYFCLSRSLDNFMCWKELSLASYQVLKLFQKGASIDEVCEWIEKQDNEIAEEAGENLQIWFQEWIGQQLLYLVDDQMSP